MGAIARLRDGSSGSVGASYDSRGTSDADAAAPSTATSTGTDAASDNGLLPVGVGLLPQSTTANRGGDSSDEQEDLFFARHVASNPAMTLAPRPVAASFCLEVPCDDVVPSYRYNAGGGTPWQYSTGTGTSAEPAQQPPGATAGRGATVTPHSVASATVPAAALLPSAVHAASAQPAVDTARPSASQAAPAAALLPFAVHAAWYYTPHTRVRQLLDASLENLLA